MRAAPQRKPTNTRAIKAEGRLAALSRRARSEASKSETAMLAVGGSLAFAVLQRKVKLPTVMGLNPKLVYGLALAIGGPRLLTGKNGERVEAVGIGVLSAAASEVVSSGGIKVSGEEFDDEIDADD